MQTFYDLNFNNFQSDGNESCHPFDNLSLALGFFDGLHSGHREVIKSAVNFALKNHTKSAVITFQDHPCCFFYDLQPKYIIKRSEKIKMLEKTGVAYLFMLKFDENLANLNAQEYLKKILIKNFHPYAISTKFNHSFRAKKCGNAQYLRDMQQIYGYKFFEIQPLKVNDDVISSTSIR